MSTVITAIRPGTSDKDRVTIVASGRQVSLCLERDNEDPALSEGLGTSLSPKRARQIANALYRGAAEVEARRPHRRPRQEGGGQ